MAVLSSLIIPFSSALLEYFRPKPYFRGGRLEGHLQPLLPDPDFSWKEVKHQKEKKRKKWEK